MASRIETLGKHLFDAENALDRARYHYEKLIEGGELDSPDPSPASSPPPPHPMPMPDKGEWKGLVEPIASNFDIKKWTEKRPPAPSGKPDEVGAFRFISHPSHFLYDDPIGFPGQPGKSHLHMFWGNTEADADSTYESLRTTGNSSVQGALLNRSAYWMPAMLDGFGNTIVPYLITTYYKQVPNGGPRIPGLGVPLPHGLRYVYDHALWYVDGRSGATLAENAAHAKPGTVIRLGLTGPNLWDGKHTDSPDHRAHVKTVELWETDSYPSESHPYAIPQHMAHIFWRVQKGEDVLKWVLSSDMGKPAGSTAHADLFAAHDPIINQRWFDHAIEKQLNCSAADYGDGTGGLVPNHEPIKQRLIPLNEIE